LELHEKQKWSWTLSALSCSAALAAGEWDPICAALLTLALGALLILAEGANRSAPCRPAALACTLWSALSAGYAAALGARAFPALPESPMIPLTLLALAWAALRERTVVAARVCAILGGCLLGFYALVLGFGLESVRAEDLRFWGAEPDALALLSMVLWAMWIPKGTGKARRAGWVGAGVLLSFLSALVAARAGSLYLATESVRVFSVMERFEGLLSTAMAVGAFGLCCLAASGGREVLRIWKNNRPLEALFWALAVVGIGLADRIQPGHLLAGNMLFCGFLPLLTRYLGKRKKLKK